MVEEIPSHLTIQNSRQQEWLRFTTVHVNVGAGNLQIRGGGQIAPCDIDGIHYDQCTVATQEILDASGNSVRRSLPASRSSTPSTTTGTSPPSRSSPCARPSTAPRSRAGVKITFCFVDVEFTEATGSAKKAQPRTSFECNGDLQGLASGWADSYHQSTPLQELDITGLKSGDYYLTHLADPDDHWLESNESNNFTWVKFRHSRQGANPEITILSHSPCVPDVICGFGGNP